MGSVPKHTVCILAVIAAWGCGSQEEKIQSKRSLTSQEARVVALTNQVRSGENLQPLSVDQHLCSVARAQAERMMQAKAINAPERVAIAIELAALGYQSDGTTLGLNVAGSKKDVDDAFVGIMKNGQAKLEMTQSKYRDLGVGVVTDDDNAVYVVQVFSARRK